MTPPKDTRSRSRSPDRAPIDRHWDSHRQRSSSPRHRHRHHHSSHHKRKRTPPPANDTYIPVTAVPPRVTVLPFSAKVLSKYDLQDYKPMFASYLDIQKGLILEDLSESEVKGRWKSFVSRWNRGDLAAGWYDPSTLQKAIATADALEDETIMAPEPQPRRQDHNDQDSEDSDVGPAPARPSYHAPGPSIPTRNDLTLRDEAVAEGRADDRQSLVQARKADKRVQKERLEDLVPRAEPGTRERQLEKKRDAAAGNRAFAEAKAGGGGEVEVGEGELMGGDAGVKEMKAREDRRKNEREVRREELLRARQLERDEKLAGMREREDATMSMLKNLARERFG